jgi:glycerophosphoryl diester phosphodiesterase
MRLHNANDRAGISRRTLIGGTLGGILFAGTACASRNAGTVETPATVPGLLADNPFYIAHRGGGGDWPELTTYAYQQAIQLSGLRAVEISVALSSDNVLVCSHDATTGRLTGRSYVIAQTPWSTLSTLMVSAAETTNPKQAPRPFSRLDEVLELVVNDFVVFVEPKTAPTTAPLMARLTALGQPQRIVWKQPVNSDRFSEAQQHGFATWGYVLNEPAHLGTNLARYARDASLDMLGAPLSETDSLCQQVVTAATSNGKPTIAFTVKSAADRERALRLGCRGLMTSTIEELLPPAN